MFEDLTKMVKAVNGNLASKKLESESIALNIANL